MPMGQRSFHIVQMACLLLTSLFSLSMHRTLKSFYIFNKIISFFNLAQENRIYNMHNTLKTCSIRGKALPMFLAIYTSKRHDVKKNSTRVLKKVLVFCVLVHVSLR